MTNPGTAALVAPGYPAPARANRALLVLALLGFVTSMEITMTVLLIEPMKRELFLSDVQIGLLQGTAYGLAYGLCSLPLGRLIDTWTRRNLLMIGVLVWAAAMAATALAHGFWLLVAARALLGIVMALLIPASLSLLGDLYPPERRSIMTSLFVAGQACGQAFGILVGGLAYDTLARLSPGSFGGLTRWRLLYLAAAAMCLLLVPPLLSISEPDRQEREGGAGAVRTAFGKLWDYRGFLGPLVAALLFSVIALQAPVVWVAPLLIRNFGLTPGQFSGWLSAITLGGGIAGTLAGGRLAELGRRRTGSRGVLGPGIVAALAAAPLALFALAPNLPLFAIMLGLDLFCAGLIPTVGAIAFTLNLPNDIRGAGIGVYLLIAAVFGTATAPAAVALLSRAFGGENMLPYAVVAVSAPSALACAVFLAVAMRNCRQPVVSSRLAETP